MGNGHWSLVCLYDFGSSIFLRYLLWKIEFIKKCKVKLTYNGPLWSGPSLDSQRGALEHQAALFLF